MLNIPITYELFCNSPKEGMIKGLWKNHSHESMVCTPSRPSSQLSERQNQRNYSEQVCGGRPFLLSCPGRWWGHLAVPYSLPEGQGHPCQEEIILPTACLSSSGREERCPWGGRGIASLPPGCLWGVSLRGSGSPGGLDAFCRDGLIAWCRIAVRFSFLL